MERLLLFEQLPEQMKVMYGLSDEEYEKELAELRRFIAASKQGKSSRLKGGEYERKVARKFKSAYGINLVRTPLSGGFHKDKNVDSFKGDLNFVGEPNENFKLHIECKNQKTLKITEWWKQTISDCPEGDIPTLIFHLFQKIVEGKVVTNNEDFILMRLDDFLSIVERGNIVDINKTKKQKGVLNHGSGKKVIRRVRKLKK